jgi:hypothetical protein
MAKAVALQQTYNFAFGLKEKENKIVLDRTGWKGYFRRGKVNFLLAQNKAALIDFVRRSLKRHKNRFCSAKSTPLISEVHNEKNCHCKTFCIK